MFTKPEQNTWFGCVPAYSALDLESLYVTLENDTVDRISLAPAAKANDYVIRDKSTVTG